MGSATKEERASVNDYIESISEPIYSFTNEELKEHDKQIRADAIDECAEAFNELAIKWFESGHMTLGDIPRLAEQLKEKK